MNTENPSSHFPSNAKSKFMNEACIMRTAPNCTRDEALFYANNISFRNSLDENVLFFSSMESKVNAISASVPGTWAKCGQGEKGVVAWVKMR